MDLENMTSHGLPCGSLKHPYKSLPFPPWLHLKMKPPSALPLFTPFCPFLYSLTKHTSLL